MMKKNRRDLVIVSSPPADLPVSGGWTVVENDIALSAGDSFYSLDRAYIPVEEGKHVVAEREMSGYLNGSAYNGPSATVREASIYLPTTSGEKILVAGLSSWRYEAPWAYEVARMAVMGLWAS